MQTGKQYNFLTFAPTELCPQKHYHHHSGYKLLQQILPTHKGCNFQFLLQQLSSLLLYYSMYYIMRGPPQSVVILHSF